VSDKPRSNGWSPGTQPPASSARQLPDGRLRSFCLTVWEACETKEQITVNDVYTIYGRVSNRNVLSGANLRRIWEFFEKLLEIKHRNDQQDRLYIHAQQFPDFKYEDLMHVMLNCAHAPDVYCLTQKIYDDVRPIYLRDIGYQEHAFHEMQDFQRSMNELAIQDTFIGIMMTGFYHFIQRTRVATGWRFYLNVKPRSILDVFEMAVREFLIAMPGDVDSVKLAAPFSPVHGPRQTEGRRDTVVIYLKLGPARARILAALRQYQREHRDFFEDEVPEMTQPCSGLAGVSEGGEPRQNMTVRVGLDAGEDVAIGRRIVASEKIVIGRSSFGSLRCQLIAEAFNRCGHDKTLFLTLVANHFANARIDVRLPYL
jgi:hypothetical protein